LLPGYARLGNGRTAENGGEHCAIFYKQDEVKVMKQGQFWLSEEPETAGSIGWDAMLPRICTWAQFSDQAGREWFVFNTHLDHVGKEAKAKGSKLIWSRMKQI